MKEQGFEIPHQVVRKDNKEYELRIDEDAVDIVVQKLCEKTGISIEEARSKLGIGIVTGLMLNREKAKDLNKFEEE